MNRCSTRFKRSAEFSDLQHNSQFSFSSVYQACEVDVFEHPRFCDEFSHQVHEGLDATAILC